MVAVQSIIFNAYPIELTIRTLHGLGITELELWEGHLPRKIPMYYDLMKKMAHENSIDIIGLVWDNKGFNPYSAKSEDQSSTLDCMKRNIEFCREIEAKFLTIAEGKPEPQFMQKPEESWNNLIDALKQFSDLAGENGITIVNEYHPGMFASTVDKAPKLVDEISSKWFKACIDLCHIDVITNGKAEDLIRVLDKRIGHVHLGDGNGTPIMHLPLGYGRINVKACIDEIKAIGYKGFWSLCLYGCPFPEYAVRKSLQWLHKI